MELVIGKALLEEMDVPTVRAKLLERGFDLNAPVTQRIDDNGDAVFSQGEVESPVARVIAGLQVGRIVNYVLKTGEVRPLIVVNCWDRAGLVNGVLLFDGTNDNGKFPVPLTVGHSGHMPLCAAWITSAEYELPSYEPGAPGPAAGTWHFPTKQPCVAAGVDAAALETAMLPIIDRLMDTINAKLDACVNACAELNTPPKQTSLDPMCCGSGILGSTEPVGAESAGPAPDDGKCQLCGEQMPDGEEMFKYHGYSGPCQPKVTASATVETPADVAHNGSPVNEPEFGIEPMTGTDLDAKAPELPS